MNIGKFYYSCICRITITVATLASFSIAAFAGGSIGWDEVSSQIRRDDPLLVDFIEHTFDVRHSGGAVRVGHDQSGNSTISGLDIGSRLPPFDFPAKLKGASGDYTFHLTLEPSQHEHDGKLIWQITIRKQLDFD